MIVKNEVMTTAKLGSSLCKLFGREHKRLISHNRASYAFGGVTNTTSQGYPIPLGYGNRRIVGAIISAGIYVEDKM